MYLIFATIREASAEEALKDAEDFVESVLALNSPLVQPVITPRFVPTCTIELMKGDIKKTSKKNKNKRNNNL